MVEWDAIRARAISSGLEVDKEVIAGRVLRGDRVFGQRVLLTALVKASSATRERIHDEVSPTNFDSSWRKLFEWCTDMLAVDGKVDPDVLFSKMEAFVTDEVGPQFAALLDRILSAPAPTPAELDATARWLRSLPVSGDAECGGSGRACDDLVLAALI